MNFGSLVFVVSVAFVTSADIGSLMQVDVKTHESVLSGSAAVLNTVNEKVSGLTGLDSGDRLAIDSVMSLVNQEQPQNVATPEDSATTISLIDTIIGILQSVLGNTGASSSSDSVAEQAYHDTLLPNCEAIGVSEMAQEVIDTGLDKTAHEDCRTSENTKWDTTSHATTGFCTIAVAHAVDFDTNGQNGNMPKYNSGTTSVISGDSCDLPATCSDQTIECDVTPWADFLEEGNIAMRAFQEIFNDTVQPCVDARADLTGQTATCVGLQADFEASFCTWYTTTEIQCLARNTCVWNLMDDWEDDLAAWSGGSTKRSIQAAIISHVICLLTNLKTGVTDITLCDDSGSNSSYFEELYATDPVTPSWPTNCSVTTEGAVPYPGHVDFPTDANSGYAAYVGSNTPLAAVSMDCTA